MTNQNIASIENYLRTISSELYFSVLMTASRKMYGKSYFSLGVGERAALDQIVYVQISSTYQAMTPENILSLLAQIKQPPGPVGFGAPHSEKNS